MMDYEVEQKFPVDDLAPIEAKLSVLGAEISEPRTEVDLYFNHPARDFAQTDEALRLERKPLAERTSLPEGRKQWWVERAKNRQIPLEDIL